MMINMVMTIFVMIRWVSDHDHDHYYNDDHGDCCDDQMSACEQLTCEQSPMAVDGPLCSGGGGLYSQHQPMIIMITSQLCPPESKDTKSATHIYQVGLFFTVSFQISPLGIVLPQRHHEVIQRVVLPTLWTLNRLSGKPIFSVHSRKISEGLWIVVGSFLMSLQCWTIILHFQTF